MPMFDALVKELVTFFAMGEAAAGVAATHQKHQQLNSFLDS